MDIKKYAKFNKRTTLVGIISGFINGIFGSGGGTILVPALNNILKVEEHQSHATALGIVVFLTTSSSVVYISKGTFDLSITYKVAIGSIIGGIVGAKLLNRFTGRHLRLMFGSIMIIAAIRMVF
jgi:uncharacterized protein